MDWVEILIIFIGILWVGYFLRDKTKDEKRRRRLKTWKKVAEVGGLFLVLLIVSMYILNVIYVDLTYNKGSFILNLILLSAVIVSIILIISIISGIVRRIIRSLTKKELPDETVILVERLKLYLYRFVLIFGLYFVLIDILGFRSMMFKFQFTPLWDYWHPITDPFPIRYQWQFSGVGDWSPPAPYWEFRTDTFLGMIFKVTGLYFVAGLISYLIRERKNLIVIIHD